MGPNLRAEGPDVATEGGLGLKGGKKLFKENFLNDPAG